MICRDTCCTGDDEAPTWLLLSVRSCTARKPYTCDACWAPIPAGSTYYRTTGLEDDQFVTVRTHDQAGFCGYRDRD